MTPEFHREKAIKITRAMRHFTTREYEAVIEGCMLAGTHWFNVALHKYGINPPAKDVMHAEYVHPGDRTRINLVLPQALKALDEIEAFRALYVRGNVKNGGRAARRALKNLDIIKKTAQGARAINKGKGASPMP
ncbi:MAG: hypothetical protein CL731_04585 [Chloroflexi bacterium]|nr:hypothetical protein [Chloroflexota bacterium]|tara:strand:+ start:10479 stop:10880 length:402 start_codon:yes stop_codon:yes gene_type:complete